MKCIIVQEARNDLPANCIALFCVSSKCKMQDFTVFWIEMILCANKHTHATTMKPNSIPNKAREFFESAQPPFQWAPVVLSSSVKRSGREADPSPPLSAEVQNACSSTSVIAVFPSCCTIGTEFITQNKYLILRLLAPVVYIMWKQYCFHYIIIIIYLYKNWRATRRLNELRFVIGHPAMLSDFAKRCVEQTTYVRLYHAIFLCPTGKWLCLKDLRRFFVFVNRSVRLTY